ncbi:MAG TPA: hypothetical protein VM101_11285 [Flavitalea sp.]|nr:hypothetical protein [Flavitalea sp.]
MVEYTKNLWDLNNEELREEFFRSSDKYFDYTNGGNICGMRNDPEYQAIKHHLQQVMAEMDGRKVQ